MSKSGTDYRKASWLYTFFYPDSAYQYNEEQRKIARKADDLKLHKVYGLIFEIERHDFDKARRTVINDRRRARQTSSDDFLPLHLALYHQAPYDLLDTLIDAYPPALKVRDPNNNLPIHIASKDEGCLLTIIKLLVKWWPESLLEKDPMYDDLPVQMTLRHHLPKEATFHYLDVMPETVGVRDQDNSTLLHMCLRYGSHVDLFNRVLKAEPAAVKVVSSKGDLPIHRACLFNASLDMITQLVDMYPESLRVVDHLKNLPIHLYYMRLRGTRPSEEAMHMFLEAFPQSVNIRNSLGHTPFQILETYAEMLESYTATKTERK
jgi:ankyrin repeat protein